jgi:hypothetical protein
MRIAGGNDDDDVDVGGVENYLVSDEKRKCEDVHAETSIRFPSLSRLPSLSPRVTGKVSRQEHQRHAHGSFQINTSSSQRPDPVDMITGLGRALCAPTH